MWGFRDARHGVPGLDTLMADARQKKFSVVLVAAFDRVARSTRHFLQVVDELDNCWGLFSSPGEKTSIPVVPWDSYSSH